VVVAAELTQQANDLQQLAPISKSDSLGAAILARLGSEQSQVCYVQT